MESLEMGYILNPNSRLSLYYCQNPNPIPATRYTWSLIGEAIAWTKSGIEIFPDTSRGMGDAPGKCRYAPPLRQDIPD